MSPQELLDIFRTNIVVMRGTPTSDIGGGPDYLKITPKAGATGEVRRGSQSITCNVMQVEAAGSLAEPGAFLTWICDYQGNDIKYQTLNNTRPFCFTANMNGCTFGIGTPQRNGVLTVSHANALDVGGNQGINQQTVHQSYMSVRTDDVKNFDARHYDVGIHNGMGLNTTTFGVYENGAWSFYYQNYAQSGLKYVLRTFRKIDVNRLTL